MYLQFDRPLSILVEIHTWLCILEKYNKNVLSISEPQDDFSSFIPPSLAAMYEL